MPNMIVPDARNRSPTASQGEADYRDENVYSALVVANTGTGSQRFFSGASGAPIPELGGSSTATANAHQTKYSDLTTNLVKPGELGASIGDGSIRAIGVTFETAAVVSTTGKARSFGMTQQEVNDVLSKVSLELKVSAKRQIIGALHMFPSGGGAFGGLSTTGNSETVGVLQNGWPGTLRRLKVPTQVARNDTIEGILALGNGAVLAFNTDSAGTDGQPSLIWMNLLCNIQGDVR